MANELLVALFGLPFVGSVLVSLFLRRSPVVARNVALVISGATALCATALLPLAGSDPTLVIEWLPGTGPMAFGLGVTSVYAALVTTWAVFLAILGITAPKTETPALSLALMLLALAAGSVAFLTEHLLARYVALEVVALSIALAPLVELRGDQGGRGFWSTYLMLRLGDVGLLTAILILFEASGTLEITPALAAAGTLSGARLSWVVFGLVLAVWVKLGNYPFHLWARWGRPLSPSAHAWLFLTVMPNLGAYLLYRVTPLLTPSAAVQGLILWFAAGTAMVAVITALTRRSLRSALIYVAATRGGLLLFAAASGLKGAVWLGLVATTPLQLLLFLTGEAPEKGAPSVLGRAARALFALAGVMLAGVGLLITWWARQAGVPVDVLFVMEASVALLVLWGVREATRSRGEDVSVGSLSGRWIALGMLGIAILAAVLSFRSLTRSVMAAAGIADLRIPTLTILLRYVVSSPALLLTTIIIVVMWQMQRRSRIHVHVPGRVEETQIETYDLQEGLTQAARALRAIVEVGFLEQIIVLSVRGVVDGSRLAYRFVEQEGLEGLIRRMVQGILQMSETLRRSHMGLLRRNLLWIPLSLMLALIVALVW